MHRIAISGSSNLAWRLVALAALLLAARPARAQLDLEVSASEVHVGYPFSASLALPAGGFDGEPELPAVDGLRIAGPSRGDRTLTTIVNGRRTESGTTTFTWSITAERPGTFVIPALTLTVHGREQTTREVELVATELPNSDFMLAAIEVERDTWYLGENIRLTLRVWVQKYTSRRERVALDARQMAGQFDHRRSHWGPFAEVLGAGRVAEVTRTLEDGTEAAYFMYVFDATVAPERPGPLDLEGVSLVHDYPVRLGRDIFRRLTIQSTRPVIAVAPGVTVTVRTPPEAGRPPWYNGAVGRFGFDVEAGLTEVSVGDPITLTLRVRDQSAGGAQLELLRPPPLGRVEALARSFKVSEDIGAGELAGAGAKIFTQTVRATSDRVREIPSLPFAYFDPVLESYETAWSDPIPITVRPSSAVSLSDVVGAPAGGGGPTQLVEVEGGLLANYSGERLLAEQAPGARPWMAAVVAAPPFLWLFMLVAHRRADRLRRDTAYARARRARRAADRRLRDAEGADPAARADAVAAALGGYVADRCDLPAGAVTRAEVVRCLEQERVAPEVIEQVQALLAECEERRYGAGAEVDGADLGRRAGECIRRLERERIGR